MNWIRNILCAMVFVLPVGFACLVLAHEVPDYNRAEWGRWEDIDRDGWDTRHEMLRRSAKPGSLVLRPGEPPFRVVAGSWVDPYTGHTWTIQSRRMEVDHVVSLYEAHLSGGWKWSQEQKRTFYNDPENLRVVHQSTNRRKGGLDVSVPNGRPREEYWCEFSDVVLSVKAKYNLDIDAMEARVLGLMQAQCPGEVEKRFQRLEADMLQTKTLIRCLINETSKGVDGRPQRCSEG